jgi:putative addiction module CopG family antidote
MTIHLSSELEALIRQDIQRGPYRSVEEFVARAVNQLHEQEEWLAAHRDAIHRQIEEGWQAAEQGKLSDQPSVESRMKARKKEWGGRRSA